MKRTLPILVILLSLTAAATIWRLSTADRVPENALTIHHQNRQVILHAKSLPLSPIQGRIVNGKGEERNIDAQGLSLEVLLDQAGIENAASITATARDAYSAELPEEDFDRANIILQEDGGFQLIVFGDPDSKRNVRNLIEVTVQ